MRPAGNWIILFVLSAWATGLAGSGCSKRSRGDEYETIHLSPPAASGIAQPAATSTEPEAKAATAAAPPSAKKGDKRGTLSAAPNPVPVCTTDGLGVTTISFTATGTSSVEIHVEAPDGPLFASSPDASGSQRTERWVKSGTAFYLQDGASPRTAEHTLATLTVETTSGGPCH